MKKPELIEAIASDAGISKKAAKNALNSFISNVSKSLAKGNKVSLIGFGTFSTSKIAARTGRNPRTGGIIKMPARMVARFKAGANLKNSIN